MESIKAVVQNEDLDPDEIFRLLGMLVGGGADENQVLELWDELSSRDKINPVDSNQSYWEKYGWPRVNPIWKCP